MKNTEIIRKFDLNQARDEDGKWTDTGASLKSFENKIKSQKFETAGVFDKDGNLILEKDGDEDSVFFNKNEMELMKSNEGATFTHNHPGGSSLSKADLMLFWNNNLGEMRAVSKGITHILYKTKNRTNYILENGLQRNILSQIYDEAFKKAEKYTDKIWYNRPNNVSDEWVKNLNYTIYHEAIKNTVNDPRLKGFLIYKVEKYE